MSSTVVLAGRLELTETRRMALAPVSPLGERENCGLASSQRLCLGTHSPPTFSEPVGQKHCPSASTNPAAQRTVTSCVLFAHSWSPTLSVIDQSPVAGNVAGSFGVTSTVLFFGTATILAATPGGCEVVAVMIDWVVPRRELLPAVSVLGGTPKSEAIPANGGGQGGRGLLKISESQPDIVGSGDGIRNFWNPV